MHAVADLSVRVGNVLRTQPAINGFPCLPAVVGAKCARSGDRNPDALGILRIEDDGVQAHAAGSWLPLRTGPMAAQPGKFLPVLRTISRSENSRVLHARIHRVGIRRRWFEVPDTLELPGMLCAVIPLVSSQRLAALARLVIRELVALGFRHSVRRRGGLAGRGPRLVPRLSSVVRSLNDLSKPTTGLRGINSVWIDRGSFHVVNLPPRKMGTADIPLFAFAVRSQNECSLAGTD